MLNQRLLGEMVEYIVKSINLRMAENDKDRPWWMGITSGKFTVHSTFELMRHKRENEEWRKSMWGKGVPFKLSFLLWRCL